VPYPNYASATAILDELGTPELERVAVLQVDNIGDFYSAMVSSDDAKLSANAKSFELDATRWMGDWCCSFVPKGIPGHIAYDLFADIDGHRDKFRRTIKGEWQPRLGHTMIAVNTDCRFSDPRNYTATCNTAGRTRQ
jgi:hypothetical protein